MGMTNQVVRDVTFRADDRETGEALQAVARVVERAHNDEIDAEDALRAIRRIVDRGRTSQTYQKALG